MTGDGRNMVTASKTTTAVLCLVASYSGLVWSNYCYTLYVHFRRSSNPTELDRTRDNGLCQNRTPPLCLPSDWVPITMLSMSPSPLDQ